jgi:hypothetical protein
MLLLLTDVWGCTLISIVRKPLPLQPDVRYVYDIQARDGATSEVYTLVMGTVTFVDQITAAS